MSPCPQKALTLIGLFLLCGCATYHQRLANYHAHIQQATYEAANKELDKNKLLRKKRNQLLYFFEKGKLYHLRQQYDSSNYFFNQADLYIEDHLPKAADVAKATLVNPMMQNYLGEDFERFMIHYYKACNYLYQGNIDEAMVEARRISLQTQQQEDKFHNRPTRYAKDAFSLILQGMIYETNKDLNNAFIAYRNAVEVYQAQPDRSYYGVTIPEQLKKDVLRTAYLNGFQNELDHFERLFQMHYTPTESPSGGSLILFWESGRVPIKAQQEFFFTLTKRGDGAFFFVDPASKMQIPFVFGTAHEDIPIKLSDIQTFRMVFPKYVAQDSYYSGAAILANHQEINLEQAENIQELAFASLRQRFLKEISLALSRIAVKKIAAYAIRSKDKEDKDYHLREGLSFGLQLYSLLSEKADTRHWQSLPANIYYARIPLQKGVNTLTLKLVVKTGGEQEVHSIKIHGTGGLVFHNHISLK